MVSTRQDKGVMAPPLCEAFAILRLEAVADDCTQEAPLKAFKNIRQFRAEAISTCQPYSRATIAVSLALRGD